MEACGIRFDVFVHAVPSERDAEILRRLDAIAASLATSTQGNEDMSKELDNLVAKVAANTDVTKAATLALNGLGAQIAAMKDDPVKLQALADTLQSDDAGLGAAVAQNTVADPASGTTPPATTGGTPPEPGTVGTI